MSQLFNTSDRERENATDNNFSFISLRVLRKKAKWNYMRINVNHKLEKGKNYSLQKKRVNSFRVWRVERRNISVGHFSFFSKPFPFKKFNFSFSLVVLTIHIMRKYTARVKCVDKRQETFQENCIFHVVKTAVRIEETSSRQSCIKISDILTLYRWRMIK
jgi:hypothetical protein